MTAIRSQVCTQFDGHVSGTPTNRPYNGGIRNSEARNIEVPLHRTVSFFLSISEFHVPEFYLLETSVKNISLKC